MELAGISFKSVRKLNKLEVAAAALPLLHLLGTLFFTYDSIGQFVLTGVIIVAWEFYLWQRLTEKTKTLTKKLAVIIPLLMIVVGSIGMGAAYSLEREKQALAADPDHIASCSISPIVSCTGSITSSAGSALGVSNLILGMVMYGALLLLGLSLMFGLKLSKQWWRLVWLGGLFGLGFCIFLIVQSLYVLGTLCLYCTTIWTVTLAFFVYMTNYALLNDYLPTREGINAWIEKNHTVPLLVAYGTIILLVYFRWSDYWNSLF